MSMTFTKLFSSITESTIWGEDHTTRIVWITMLAMADRKGRVWGSIPGLANRARVDLPLVEVALKKFQEKDFYSRTTDHEGRRIQAIDGGWVLLNHSKYRAVRDEEVAKEKAALRVAKHRASKKDIVTNVTDVTQSNDNAEAYQMQNQSHIQIHTQKTDPPQKPASNEAFEEFYKAYPRKVNKKGALKVWSKINPEADLVSRIMFAVEAQCKSEQWKKDGGAFIPHPATWLNQERWLDVVKVVLPSTRAVIQEEFEEKVRKQNEAIQRERAEWGIK